MTFLSRIGSGRPNSFRFPGSFIILVFWLVSFFPSTAAVPPYKIEVRLTEEPSLQFLDNQGKTYCNLIMGSVRQRINLEGSPLLASFGKDSQHHFVIMLGLDMGTEAPVTFLFGRNLLVVSPEANLTLQLSEDHATAKVSPSLFGKIWINGTPVSRGESRIISLSGSSADGKEPFPSVDQPRPSIKDFNSIPPPSI